MGAQQFYNVANQQELRKLIEQTKAIHADRVLIGQQRSMTTYQIAKNLSEVKRTEACERALGVSFKNWVATLKDAHGRPRTWSWARALMSLHKKVSYHPHLVTILDNQEPDDAAGFVDFSSAYWVARLAEEENWQRKVADEMRKDKVENTEREAEKRSRLTMLYYQWGTKPVNIIKSRLDEIVGDKADAGIPKSWPYHGGPVDPQVKEAYDTVLVDLAKMFRPGESVEDMTFTQEMETIGEGVSDLISAIKEVGNGNTGPIESIVQQLSE